MNVAKVVIGIPISVASIGGEREGMSPTRFFSLSPFLSHHLVMSCADVNTAIKLTKKQFVDKYSILHIRKISKLGKNFTT